MVITQVIQAMLTLFVLPFATIPYLWKLADKLYEIYTGYALVLYAVDAKYEENHRIFWIDLLKTYVLPSYYGIVYTPRSTYTSWRNFLIGALPDRIVEYIHPTKTQVKTLKTPA